MVILGDMNIYNDYIWPLRIFTEKIIKRNNPCAPYTQKQQKTNLTLLYDTWEAGNKTGKGLTFSNMVCLLNFVSAVYLVYVACATKNNIHLLLVNYAHTQRYAHTHTHTHTHTLTCSNNIVSIYFNWIF